MPKRNMKPALCITPAGKSQKSAKRRLEWFTKASGASESKAAGADKAALLSLFFKYCAIVRLSASRFLKRYI